MKAVLLFLTFLFLGLCDDQPPITIINYRPGPDILICSIDVGGSPGPQWSLSAPDPPTLFNVTVTPTDTLGKYHVMPSELYDCGALYQPVSTFALEAVGSIVNNRKIISLEIHLFNQGFPKGVDGIELYQNGTRALSCTETTCGPNGAVTGSVYAEPMVLIILD